MRSLTTEEAALLYKLYRRRKFGASHILEVNLLTGYPPERLADLHEALDRLKRDGIVARKPTRHGPAVSIPPSLGKAIYDELRRHYPFLPPPPWLRWGSRGLLT
ncbi:MAG: hypothetical protein A3K65_08905 [Euryarchaeota archaeon RBG_16_68_12]|nr:MAG: hypothetical protein A3K65_08905 [Euryarchaeota archaeon RBG_16_68_12]